MAVLCPKGVFWFSSDHLKSSKRSSKLFRAFARCTRLMRAPFSNLEPSAHSKRPSASTRRGGGSGEGEDEDEEEGDEDEDEDEEEEEED
eukprot:9491005-Pyramimonas_sp.AAC.1